MNTSLTSRTFGRRGGYVIGLVLAILAACWLALAAVPTAKSAPAGPAVEVPTKLYFPATEAGEKSKAKKVTVKSTGSQPLQVTSVFILSFTTVEFVIDKDECSGKTLAPGEKCEIKVRFAPSPTSKGSYDANLIISTNVPGNAGSPNVKLYGDVEDDEEDDKE